MDKNGLCKYQNPYCYNYNKEKYKLKVFIISNTKELTRPIQSDIS